MPWWHSHVSFNTIPVVLKNVKNIKNYWKKLHFCEWQSSWIHTLSSGATCQMDTVSSSTSLLMDKYEGWYTFVGSSINTLREKLIIQFFMNEFNAVVFFFCGAELNLLLTGNRTEETSFLVDSTKKSIQKSTSSCLGAGGSLPGFLKCW